MKRSVAAIAVLLAFVLGIVVGGACTSLLGIRWLATDLAPEPDSTSTRHALEGTWENTADDAEDYRQLKYVTPTHMVWVIYDRNDKTPIAAAGGTYKLDGESYQEYFHFATPMWEHLVDKQHNFRVKFEEGLWRNYGRMANGIFIDERWRKLRQ